MKRFLALAALVLGLAACQTEPEGLDVIVGGEVDTVVSVSLPEATRATSDVGFNIADTSDNYEVRYILEIYLGDSCQRHIKVADGASVAFPVRLAPGRDYTFVAWADIVEKNATDPEADRYYNTQNGLDQISIIENTEVKWNAMDETRDAFTAKEAITGFTAQAVELKLKRPFAKLRVVATDREDVVALGLTPATATVVYSQPMPRTYNALTGIAGGAADKSHNITYPATPVYVDATGEYTLFADYFFVPTSGTAKFEFNVYADAAQTNLIKGTNFNTDIFVEANKLTTIKGDVLTTGANISIDIENGGAMDGTINEIFAGSSAAAQAALDNAVANTTIHLEPGVNYGTLYLRPINGGAQTKVVDWLGNNYGFETYSLFENLTIVGAEGATIDAIKIEGGTYYHTAHSQSDLYPVMLSLIELKNVVFDGVTFTGKGGYDPQGYGNAVNLSGNNIKVDGLTLKNCVLNNSENNARLLYKTESTTHVHNYAYNGENFTFTPSLKDITINGCTFNGGYMGLELRETENVTITNNVFNVADRNILLPVNTGCTYSGNITITGNVSNNAKERFVRADGTGDAVVVITNNTINNYLGADADYIKVTNGNNVTIEDNTISIDVTDTNAAQAALDNATPGTIIELQPGVNYGTLVFRQTADSVVVDITDAGGDAAGNEKYRRIEDLTIIGAEGAVVDGFDFQVSWISGSGASYIDIENLTVKNVTFSGETTPFNFEGSKGSALGIDGLTIENCKMTDEDHNNRFVFQQISGYKALNDKSTNEFVMTAGIKNLTITNCEVTGAYMVIESRAMENLIITNNTFTGIKARDMLITSDTTYHADKTYTGEITITGNTSIAGEERFIRGSLNNSDAVVVITNNTITNYAGQDADYIKVEGGNNVTIENNQFIKTVTTAEELEAAIKAGGNYALANDIAMAKAVAISNANFTLDGNGKTISMTEDATNNIALFDITGGKATFKNVTFDGIQKGAIVRTVGAEFVANNLTAQNCNHTVDQGLFRLFGESTITNSTFKNNICKMVVSFCFDHDNDSMGTCLYTLNIDGCEFAKNTCSTTAVCYYANGSAATLNGNKFVNNTLNVSNGATVYLGFKKNCTVTDNLFDGNTVTATSKRSAGGLMVGNAAVVTGNAFVNNTVTVNGATGYGNDVCASPYYAAIDLSGNYWGGGAPVENDDYYKEYNNYEVIINDYLTVNPFN